MKDERWNVRDQRISARHRLWGTDCPMVDVDFLVLEYNHGKVVALVEYKHERGQHLDPNHPSALALRDLADRAGLPVWSVRYADDFSWFEAKPLNLLARGRHSNDEPVKMSERDYVTWMCALRHAPLPVGLFDDAGFLMRQPQTRSV
jgi:hypothetical protein